MSILQAGFAAVAAGDLRLPRRRARRLDLGRAAAARPLAHRRAQGADRRRACCCRRASSSATTSTAQWAVIALMCARLLRQGRRLARLGGDGRRRAEGSAGLTGGLFNTFGNPAGIVTPIVIGYILQSTGSFDGRAGLRRRARAARGGELPRHRRRHPPHRAAAPRGRRCRPRHDDPRAPRAAAGGGLRPLRGVVAGRPNQRGAGRTGALAVRALPARPLAPAALRARLRGGQLAAARLRALRAARDRWARAGHGADGRRPNGDAVSLAGPRLFLNTGEDYQRYWPQRLARLVAAAISVGTVVLRVARRRSPPAGRRSACSPALVVALLPMFAFRAGHVSNDALLALLRRGRDLGHGAPAARAVHVARRAGGRRRRSALAYLSKISAIALVPPFALALARRRAGGHVADARPGGSARWRWPARSSRPGRSATSSSTAIRSPARRCGRRSRTSSPTGRCSRAYFSTTSRAMLTKSFIGIFGWANLLLPQLAYAAYLAAVRGRPRRRGARRLAPAARLAARRRAGASPVLAALAVVVHINLQFTQPQGRYLLPGLPAFAVLLALGLRALPAACRASSSPAVVGLALLGGQPLRARRRRPPRLPSGADRTLATGERVMVPSR